MTETDITPDFEGFARAILDDWPTGDIEGSDLFDLSVSYGMIAEIPGGYDPDRDIDAHGISPEAGDPWYEYTFRGESGPGRYSVRALRTALTEAEAERDEARARMAVVVEEACSLHYPDHGATGFALALHSLTTQPERDALAARDARVRREALEEAAKVCEDTAYGGEYIQDDMAELGCLRCRDAIRAMILGEGE